MAWLQKRPEVSVNVPFYTLGQHHPLLVVGLGNPGAEYDGTRHNIGFRCIDDFVAKHETMTDWADAHNLKALVSKGQIGSNRVIAIKPTTYMNVSGEAVQAAVHFYKIPTENIVVIHDELDISFGQIRLRMGGSSAGHNGVKSVTGVIGENYGRIRIGIGPKEPPQIDAADFVLQKFTKPQIEQLPNLLRETTAILTEWVYAGRLPHETRTFIV